MRFRSLMIAAAAALIAASTPVMAQLSPNITYQGRLVSGGAPANAAHDFEFRLFNAAAAGAQVDVTKVRLGVPITDGLFTVNLDFAAASFGNANRWLEIRVRPAGGGAYTTLSPRVQLTPAPFANFALQSLWSGLSGVPAGFADGVDDNTTYSAGAGLQLGGTTFSVAPLGITTGMIANGNVTLPKISSAGAGVGQAIIYDGINVAWGNPSATIAVPFNSTANSASTLIRLTQTGSGRTGEFIINNSGNFNDVFTATTNGTGDAGVFQITNASSIAEAVEATSNGGGNTFQSTATGTGNALSLTTSGTGGGIVANITNVANVSTGYSFSHAGTGIGASFTGLNTSRNNPVVSISGAGSANALEVVNNGTGRAAFLSLPASNLNDVLEVNSSGPGDGLEARASGSGSGLFAVNTGTGRAGFFQLFNASSTNHAVEILSNGIGSALQVTNSSATSGSGALIRNTNTTNASIGLEVVHAGNGAVAQFESTNNSRSGNIVNILGTGSGNSLNVSNSGSGRAAFLSLPASNSNDVLEVNSSGVGDGLEARASGSGSGLFAINTGSGSAGSFSIANSTNPQSAVSAIGNGLGRVLSAVSSNTTTGGAAFFRNSNASNTQAVVEIEHQGTGVGLLINQPTTGIGATINLSSAGSPSTGFVLNHAGIGDADGFEIFLTNAGNSGEGLDVSLAGSGNGIESSVNGDGRAGYFLKNAGASGAAPNPAIEAISSWNNAFAGEFRGLTSGANQGQGLFVTAPVGRVGLQVAGGTKSGVVATSQGARALYTEESTEVWFTDYGFGETSNGVAVISFESLFRETVNVNEKYHVFLQAYGDAELYVTNRTATGFEVRTRNGQGNVEFSYRIVAKRLGYENTRLLHAPWADDDPNLFPEKAKEFEVRKLQNEKDTQR